MIEVYSWPTPNDHKVHIMLEECGMPQRALPVDIGRGAQFAPKCLAINSKNKFTALVDPDGTDGEPISPIDSGAFLLYPAGKAASLLPERIGGRCEVQRWLMLQTGGVGPMLGQGRPPFPDLRAP